MQAKQTKHTPGPWHIDLMDSAVTDSWYTINGGNFGGIATLDIPDKTDYPEAWAFNEANARLIAAAPEMLEALKNLVDVYGDCFGKPDIERAEDAINKAEGK